MRGYKLPQVLDDHPRVDICLSLPDDPDYIRAFWSQFYELTRWWTWEHHTKKSPDRRARDAAAYWLNEIYLPNRQRFDDGVRCGDGCMTCLIDVRLRSDGVLVKEYGDGTIQAITPIVTDVRIQNFNQLQQSRDANQNTYENIGILATLTSVLVENGYLSTESIDGATTIVAQYLSDVRVENGILEKSREQFAGGTYEEIAPYIGNGVQDVKIEEAVLFKRIADSWIQAGNAMLFDDVAANALPPGTNPSADIVSRVLTFGIPRGMPGTPGEPGDCDCSLTEIYQMPTPDQRDKLCYAATQIVASYADTLRDAFEVWDGTTDLVLNAVIAINDFLPVVGDIILSAGEYIEDIEQWVMPNLQDPDALSLASCELLCFIENNYSLVDTAVDNFFNNIGTLQDLINVAVSTASGEYLGYAILAFIGADYVARPGKFKNRVAQIAAYAEFFDSRSCSDCPSCADCDWVQTWDLINWDIPEQFIDLISGSYSYGNGYIGAPRPSANGKIYNNMQLNILRPEGFTGEFNYIKMVFDVFSGGTTADNVSPPIRLYNDQSLEFESAGYPDFEFGTDKEYKVDLENKTSTLYAITASPNAWNPGGVPDGYVALKALEICGTGTNPFV